MSDGVLSSCAGRVAVITLNRPEARNAVNVDVALGLGAAVDRLEGDPDVWVGVLDTKTTEQSRPVFCAGADLEVISETGDAAVLDTDRGGFAGFVYRERTKPIVVAVAAAHQDNETVRPVSKARLDEVLASEDAEEGLRAFIEKHRRNGRVDDEAPSSVGDDVAG